MLAKINKLKNWQVAIIIAVMGFAVFSTGLISPFRDDDITQITSSVPVHSITHIKVLFEGGTFYEGKGLAPLSGVYYKPLMTTVYSLLYTFFGPRTLAFHLFQLLLYIASAVLLFLVFKYSFKTVLALLLALIFLVHPLNSQVVFAIPAMQDVLFFFFGILAFWLLLRYRSVRVLFLVALCLFLSMLSKETAVAFIFISFLYLFIFNRERFYKFIWIMLVPVGLYLALRINAVGLLTHENSAPIDQLGLVGRLFTAPSIMLFYITRIVFPWKLASTYYWIYPTFSFRHVLLPLLIDLTVVGCFVYIGGLLHKRVSKAKYYTYIFFSAWTAMGLLLHLQIIPLDTTVFEPYFYFSMAGLLGMIGIILGSFKIRPTWILYIAVILIGLFGIRSAVRGLDWEHPVSLAYKDISVSPDDYVAYNDIAINFNRQHNYAEAVNYIQHSIKIFPAYFNYFNLGVFENNLGNHQQAYNSYITALKYGNDVVIYENLSELSIVYGNRSFDEWLFTKALGQFPDNSKILTNLAIIEDKYNDNTAAKQYIQEAANNGPVSQILYNKIMNDQSFNLNLQDINQHLKIQ
ncbi:MAG: hypothetical protein ABSB12_03035 [Candidatus Saccharimonadales bacterium]